MTDQTQQPAQLSEKVTPTLLDRMYNNFTKLTDWVINGENSKYPMPKALAWLFGTTKKNESDIDELKSLVTTLQKNLVTKEQQIVTLANNIAVIDANNKELAKQLSDLVTQQAQASQPAAPVQVQVQAPQPIVVEPVEPVQVAVQAQAPVAPVVDELVDLDDVATAQAPQAPQAPEPVTASVSPNEQAIQVSAAAVDAGNIDPTSYQALDAEISNLLGK